MRMVKSPAAPVERRIGRDTGVIFGFVIQAIFPIRHML